MAETRVEVRRHGPGLWYMRCDDCEGIECWSVLYDWADTWDEAMTLGHVHLLEAHTDGRVVPELLATIERVLGHVHSALGVPDRRG